ncbi:MAG: tetratricopeptide repeat protein [Verrucomicrobiota bacterium]
MTNIFTKLFAFFAVFFGLLVNSTLFAAGSSYSEPEPDAAEIEKEAIGLYNEGTQLLYQSDFKGAEKLFKKALKKKKDIAEAHNNLAFVLRKQGEGKFSQALKHYNEAVSLDPDLAEARMYRGVLYTAMGDTASAEKDLKWLKGRSPKLASELQWVIENGKEKEPAQFFGVSIAL